VSAVAKAVREVPAALPLDRPRFHRFSVEQYHRMIESGILREHDRVHLIGGIIVDKMTHNPPHDGTVLLIQTAVLQLLPPDWVLRIQSAITMRDSEPEPDLVAARGPIRRYMRSHPRPKDIGLLIEVADSSLQEDRGMALVYAEARIPTYWIVNLVERQIEVYTRPRAGKSRGYHQRQDFGPASSIPVMLAGREIGVLPVRQLLP